MEEIEHALRRNASTPNVKYSKERVESHVRDIQRALAACHMLSSGEGPIMGESLPHRTPTDPHGGVTTSMSPGAIFTSSLVDKY